MKRGISLILIFTMLCVLLSGCSFTFFEEGVGVEFYVGDELYATSSVAVGKSVASKNAPELKNLIFVGWFYDKECTIEHDFSLPVLVNLKLYAGYTIDAVAASDMINDISVKSTVTVHNKSYNVGYAGVVETSSFISLGSGVVIDISGGYCYVLTNCHVANTEEGYSKSTLTVEDAWGNQFEAQIYQNAKSKVPAISDEYDLALICFKYTPPKETQELVEVGIASDPLINDYVIALGSPGGIKNTASFGKVVN
jgi:S1-C subfamily serine protease/predicted small secreted protein